MTMFDERCRNLDEALREAMKRLEQYEGQELLLKDSLVKLSNDVNSKLDSGAEKKMRKFLGKFSIFCLVTEDISLLRPLVGKTMFKCISCDFCFFL